MREHGCVTEVSLNDAFYLSVLYELPQTCAWLAAEHLKSYFRFHSTVLRKYVTKVKGTASSGDKGDGTQGH